MARLLLTSFATWRAHQSSNTSDDLIGLLDARNQIPADTLLLRQLPVHFQLAPCRVITAMLSARPTVVVCCGMAEQRSLLALERNALWEGNLRRTRLNLERLSLETHWTEISDDAGTYVCNHLYYQLLSYAQKHCWPVHCLFIHVPPITQHNQAFLIHDLALILSRLAAVARPSNSDPSVIPLALPVSTALPQAQPTQPTQRFLPQLSTPRC